VIKRITLRRYRGFEHFEAGMYPHAFLVGPNSAGKSTVIEALDLAERCLKVARRRKPTMGFLDHGRACRGFPIPAPATLETDDPVRFDFGTEEARVDVEWASGAILHMIWPEDDEDGRAYGRFWLETPPGRQSSLAAIASLCPPLFSVPVITPLDHFEELKTVDYVKDKASTRLASRHFRNHLRLLRTEGGFDDFCAFVQPWLHEITVQDVEFDPSSNRMAVFYLERRSRIPKELAWAGDGLQIWLQLLWHLYRARGAATIALDEPEVYLHPDLQRRLVRLLEDLGPQIIIASHSSEVVTEALPDSVVWVDRATRRGRRSAAKAIPKSLTDSLGSNYNLALVRSLRSRIVVAVEGSDTRALRVVARIVGASALATESDLTIVPLRSFSNWANSEPLRWIAHDVLGPAASLAVLLSGDSRPHHFNTALVRDLQSDGIHAYVWPYRELANVFLSATILARAAGTDEYAMRDRLLEAIEHALGEAREHWLLQQQRFRGVSNGLPEQFDEHWQSPDGAVRLVSAPLVLAHINQWLEVDGYRELTAESAAKAAHLQNLPVDVITALLAVDEL